MKRFAGHKEVARNERIPRTVVLGNFDGVHLGHRALIATAQSLKNSAPVTVYTFFPHPRSVLSPERAPQQLTSLERRLELFAEIGVDAVVIEPFTSQFAQQSAQKFVLNVLRESLQASSVVVGYNFRFGQAREGTVEFLRTHGAGHFTVHEQAPIVHAEGAVSSSAIRLALQDGDVALARAMLGRPHDVTGPVVRGHGRGRELGIPTANVDTGAAFLPRPGIYAVWVTLPGRNARVMGAASLGTNPTFQTGAALTLEVHLIDFIGDLYGATIRVEFATWLRPEAQFDNVPSLLAQIHQDIANCRVALAGQV